MFPQSYIHQNESYVQAEKNILDYKQHHGIKLIRKIPLLGVTGHELG